MSTPMPADQPFPPRARRMVERSLGTMKQPSHDRDRRQRLWRRLRAVGVAGGFAAVAAAIALEVTTGHVVGASETAWLIGGAGGAAAINYGIDAVGDRPIHDYAWEAWDKWRLAIAVVDQLLQQDREVAAKSWLAKAPTHSYRAHPREWNRWLNAGGELLKPRLRRTLTAAPVTEPAAKFHKARLKKDTPAKPSEWTGHVEDAWRKVGALERVVATVRRGPLAERLAEVVRHAHELAEDAEHIAVRAEAVSDSKVQRREMADVLAAIQRAVDDVAEVASMNRDRDAALRLRDTTRALRDAHEDVADISGTTATA